MSMSLVFMICLSSSKTCVSSQMIFISGFISFFAHTNSMNATTLSTSSDSSLSCILLDHAPVKASEIFFSIGDP